MWKSVPSVRALAGRTAGRLSRQIEVYMGREGTSVVLCCAVAEKGVDVCRSTLFSPVTVYLYIVHVDAEKTLSRLCC